MKKIPDTAYWKVQLLSITREKTVKSCFCSSQQFYNESTLRSLDFQSSLKTTTVQTKSTAELLTSVLSLAAMGLTFFIAACMVVCFG